MLLREPQHPASCNSPSRTARTCGKSYATAAGVLGCWKHRSALLHTACWRCWNRPARMLEPVIVSATTGDGHSDDRCCNRPAKMLEPAMAITTTGVAFCCDSEQQPVRMATAIFSYAGTSSLFTGTGVQICCDGKQQPARMATAIFSFLLEPACFAGTSSLFCWNGHRRVLGRANPSVRRHRSRTTLFCLYIVPVSSSIMQRQSSCCSRKKSIWKDEQRWLRRFLACPYVLT